MLAQTPSTVNQPIGVNYIIPASSGPANGDYDLLVINSGGLIHERFNVPVFVFAAGATINPNIDLVNYSDYTWEFVPVGLGIGAGSYGTFAFTTIVPNITFTGGGVNIAENGGTTNLTVSADAAIGKDLDITVTYSSTENLVGGSGSDFTNTEDSYNTETITIPGGIGTSNTTAITAVADNNLEGNESIIATLDVSTSYTGGGAIQTVTITDDELVDITVSASPITENGGTVDFTATVNGVGVVENGAKIIPISWSGTALATEYADEGNITIANGASSGLIPVSSTDDDLLEDDETIIATVTTGYPYFGGTEGTVTITDDEFISLSGAASIKENGGSATLTATIVGANSGTPALALVGSGALTLNVAYGGSATNGTDYTNVGSFTIAHGGETGTFDIVPINDFDIETDETVIATISTAVGHVDFEVIGQASTSQTVIILDDDFLTAPVHGLTGVSVEPTFTWIDPDIG